MKARNRRVGPGRSALQRYAQERGKHRSNLWLQYGSKIGRDVVLHSDVEYEHFLWLEADHEVSRYVLEPTPYIVALGLDNVRTRFDALVILRNGHRQLREIKATDIGQEQINEREAQQRLAQEIAALGSFEYVRIGPAQLDIRAQLIRDWHRCAAYIAAARDIPLVSYENEIALLVRREGIGHARHRTRISRNR